MHESDQQRAHALAHGVARLNRRLRQERRSDLTPSQLSVMGTVLRLGSATPSAVAAHERVQPPTVTRMINSLVDAGLVMRRPHPDDGRQVLVSLSAAGEDVLARERDRRDGWLEEQLAALDPAERELLARTVALLERIADA